VAQMGAAAGAGGVPGLAGEFPGLGALMEPPPKQRNNVAAGLYGLAVVERHGVPLTLTLSHGLPALLWLAIGPGRARFAPAAALVLLFSLGPQVGERAMPHYMAAWWGLPFFERLWFPYRMTSVTMIFASLGVGFLARRLLTWRPSLARLALPAVALYAAGAGLERSRLEVYPFVTRDFAPPQVITWIGEQGGAIIDMPFGIYKPSVVWQVFHQQPTFGGMGESAPMFWPEGMRRRLRNDFVDSLRDAARRPGPADPYDARQRARIEDEGFRWVVLHRDLITPRDATREAIGARAAEVTAAYVELMGPPAAVEGPLLVWDLLGEATPPAPIAATEARLAAPLLLPDDRPAYEVALEEAGRRQRSHPGGPP